MLFVLDTSVLITAALSPNGGAAKLLELARTGPIKIALSPKLHEELTTRLTTRERFRRWLTVDEAQMYADAIALVGEWFYDRPDAEVPQVCRDPDDDFVIALYQDTQAVMLVSNDRDILDMRYPGLHVGNPKRALATIEYRHEWGEQFVPGDFEQSLLQVQQEGSSRLFAVYTFFLEVIQERAMDVLPHIVVPETHQAFVEQFDRVRVLLEDRGLASRPHFASPEIAYLKLPPNPGESVRVVGDAPLPADTIFATLQHCPDLEDPLGFDFGCWRVWAIGDMVAPELITPRPSPRLS